jgi:hypothetical protein
MDLLELFRRILLFPWEELSLLVLSLVWLLVRLSGQLNHQKLKEKLKKRLQEDLNKIEEEYQKNLGNKPTNEEKEKKLNEYVDKEAQARESFKNAEKLLKEIRTERDVFRKTTFDEWKANNNQLKMDF